MGYSLTRAAALRVIVMREAERLSALKGNVYDATLDPRCGPMCSTRSHGSFGGRQLLDALSLRTSGNI
jgi:hypothetical protein